MMVTTFYSNLYPQEGVNVKCNLPLGCFFKIEHDDLSLLAKSFVCDEIRQALHQMSPFKAQGLDGFYTSFF